MDIGPMGRGGARRRTRRRVNRRNATMSGSASNPAPESSPEPTGDAIAEIEKLAELRDKGILTEEEFSAKKKELLGL